MMAAEMIGIPVGFGMMSAKTTGIPAGSEMMSAGIIAAISVKSSAKNWSKRFVKKSSIAV